jgi:transposase-like protein
VGTVQPGAEGRDGDIIRRTTRPAAAATAMRRKAATTATGWIELEISRDRQATFDP